MTEKRFVMPDGDLDTDVTLIDTLTGKEYEDNFNDIVDLLNELNDENQELQGKYDAQKQLFCQLNSDKNNIWQDYQDLKKENEQLKKENYELHKRLGDFEPFERYMKERTSKTSLEDIIGIVKTDEPTNSVELKKELYK